jgi:muramoyltetrapeptide carboxypeptidase LdcA involved in peptidoglycan recycling
MPGALQQDGWHACSPEVRARDLQAAFADPEIDAIQTMRGGYGSAQVIPLLDFDAIAETPKAFVGLSDITALHAALEGQTPSLTAQARTAEHYLHLLDGRPRVLGPWVLEVRFGSMVARGGF